MRVLLWILGIPLVLLILAIFLLPMLVDEKELIDLATQRIEEQSGVQISVAGNAALTVFPQLALTTSDVTVVLPEGGTRIEAGYLQAGVALLPLLRSSVQMDSITVDGVTITSLAADAESARAAAMDTSTLSPSELDAFYAARAVAREAAAAEAAAAAVGASMALEVQELSLRDITLRTVDDAGALISEVQLKFLTASDLNTDGRPVPLTAQILIPGETPDQPIDILVQGSATIDINANTAALSDIGVIVEGATAEKLTLSANGTAELDSGIANLAVELASGTLSGNGSVRYNAYESPMIDADLKLTELNPALLLLAGPEAAEAAASAGTPDAGGDQPLPLHALRMVDTRATLAIDRVVLESHTLEAVKAQLRIVDGVATLEPVTARLHGGDIRFKVVFNGRYNNAKLDTEGGVQGLAVGQALQAMEAGLAASGDATLRWKLSGAGRSSGELTQSLTGPINFDTEAITLQGIAMERMFCRGVALVNQESLEAEFPADTAFEALNATVQLEAGVARLDPLTARLAAASFNGKGNLDLSSQDLRASFRAQLLPALGEVDPACRIDERLADLRWPVECKGNLADDPAGWCGVNTAEIVKDLAEGEAKRAVKKEAGKLFKKLLGD